MKLIGAAKSAGDLCRRDVAVVVRSTLLVDAAREMRDRHVGCLVVVEETGEGRIVTGILTDRDIVTAVVARDADAASLSVGDVMCEDVVCVREDDAPHDVLATMRHRRVRRVPVTGPGQRLVGLVSADDLLQMLAQQLQALAQAVGEQVQVEQITRP